VMRCARSAAVEEATGQLLHLPGTDDVADIGGQAPRRD